MLSLGFTVAFSVFVLAFIDWSKLMNCHDEHSCKDLNHYISLGHVGFSSLFGFAVMGTKKDITAFAVFSYVQITA
jgi:hypothetical protein